MTSTRKNSLKNPWGCVTPLPKFKRETFPIPAHIQINVKTPIQEPPIILRPKTATGLFNPKQAAKEKALQQQMISREQQEIDECIKQINEFQLKQGYRGGKPGYPAIHFKNLLDQERIGELWDKSTKADQKRIETEE